ncbi:MAG TPA: transketolase C-terminal domain-containing protein [Pseudomonadales bacterium]
MRTTFVKTLTALATQDERIFLITPDMGFSVLETFQDRFPDRFLNVGIAESNAVGIAAGLALSGKIVYVYSIIPFVCMRPFEQVRVDVAYMNTNVRLVGVGAGLSYGPAGGTHHAVEDVALMRALPNMSVVSPCDPWEVAQAVSLSVQHQGPMYIRLARNGEPVVSNPDAALGFGHLNSLRREPGADVLLLFSGNASDIALAVHEGLRREGVVASLISVPFLKPLDSAGLLAEMTDKKLVVTIEEHCQTGGLASAVAEVLVATDNRPRFRAYNLGDRYSHVVGNQQFIRERFGFTAESILRDLSPQLRSPMHEGST